MTDSQASKTSDEERRAWVGSSLKKGPAPIDRWYADTTREPIRDETLRDALKPIGAAIERAGLQTTSSAPRWALERAFADLFFVDKDRLDVAIGTWRDQHLSKGARARLTLIHGKHTSDDDDSILVSFPNGETRRLSAGESGKIARAVVEQFTVNFLGQPAVLWLSESRTKVVNRDDDLARRLGLDIDPSRVLPDIILVDLEPSDPMFVFIEVVATGGVISQQRQVELFEIIERAGYDRSNVAFVSAFLDRGGAVFRKFSSNVAWDSFVWFVSEPASIVHYRSGIFAVPVYKLVAELH